VWKKKEKGGLKKKRELRKRKKKRRSQRYRRLSECGGGGGEGGGGVRGKRTLAAVAGKDFYERAGKGCNSILKATPYPYSLRQKSK